ncbi:tol-pal system YbgF family protein [Elusimicrobiota bacterium]
MTRKWVKNELRKNPLEKAVLGAVDYYSTNKNTVFVGIVVCIILFLFAAFALKNRIDENKKAAQLFAFAQSDYDRFNYSSAVKKLANIEKSFSTASIMPQVFYYIGLSYYKQGDADKAEEYFKKNIDRYKNNSIIDQVKLSLAFLYEDTQRYDEAIGYFQKIDDGHFLKPEALTGIARINEINQNIDEAIDIYTKLQSHYVNSYWAQFAEKRLNALGIRPKQIEDDLNRLQLD